MSDMSQGGGMSGHHRFQRYGNELHQGHDGTRGTVDKHEGVVLGSESSNGRMSEANTIQVLSRIMYPPMSLNALASLALVFSNYLDIELPEEATRTKSNMLQWYSKNITLIEPLFDRVTLEYTQQEESSDTHTSGD